MVLLGLSWSCWTALTMANIDRHFLNANTRFCYLASTSSFHLTVKYYRNMIGKLREKEMLWECEYCFHAAFVYCVVPENIDTLWVPMGVICKFWGGGWFLRPIFFSKSKFHMNLNWNFQQGGRVKLDSPLWGEYGRFLEQHIYVWVLRGLPCTRMWENWQLYFYFKTRRNNNNIYHTRHS